MELYPSSFRIPIFTAHHPFRARARARARARLSFFRALWTKMDKQPWTSTMDKHKIGHGHAHGHAHEKDDEL